MTTRIIPSFASTAVSNKYRSMALPTAKIACMIQAPSADGSSAGVLLLATR